MFLIKNAGNLVYIAEGYKKINFGWFKMKSIEKDIEEIKIYFNTFEEIFLANQQQLWDLFKLALEKKVADNIQQDEMINDAKIFLNCLFNNACPLEELAETIHTHIRGKRSIFLFLQIKDVFLNCIVEYISNIVAFEDRIDLVKIIFKLKHVIESIAWQTETNSDSHKEIITYEFLKPIQKQIDELLHELASWVNPIMAVFFMANQKGEMQAFSSVQKDISIFEDINIRVSMSSQWGQGPVAHAYRTDKVVYVNNRQDNRLEPFLPFWEKVGINSAILLPVTRGHYKFGVLALTFATERANDFRVEDALAPFIDKFTNFILVNYKEGEEKVYKSLLLRNYDKSFQALVSLLEKKDKYTAYHSQLVTSYALKIAENLNISNSEQELLRVGGILHDIGKVGILDNILLKPGKLNVDEWAEIKKHPAYGFQIITQMDVHNDISEIIHYHHERWDGNGYPIGLKGTRIPYLTRIVSMADTLEAITSNRPYRKANDFSFAQQEIFKNKGNQFDPELVDRFMSIPIEEFTSVKNQIENADTSSILR